MNRKHNTNHKHKLRRSRQNQKHARRADLRFERLEPRLAMAGLPTLIDLVVGTGASDPRSFTNVNNTVFFNATDPVNGAELWKSDGTAAGSALVKNINPADRKSVV